MSAHDPAVDGDTGPSGGLAAAVADGPQQLVLEFCGEWTPVPADRAFTIGRDADFVVEDNPYLHRRFLELRWDRLWWLGNVGSQLAATVSDGDGRIDAWLAPGASMPVVFGWTTVRFTAGPTSYELGLQLTEPHLTVVERAVHPDGTTTIGRAPLSPGQRALIVALAEPVLRQTARGAHALPSSADAAARLGWTLKKFNRTLDNTCHKFARCGVPGMHGGPGTLASTRRARLVEYALSVRLITRDDLALLDQLHRAGDAVGPED